MRFTAGLLAFAAFVACAQDGEQRAPFVTTPSDVVMRMLRLAGTGPADLVADLGSGDGRIVIAAAEKYGARGVADKVTFVKGNLFTADISRATVVTLYLSPTTNLRLRDKLRRELRPGTRVVSHRFDMGDWKPERERLVGNVHVFLWTIP